MKELIAAYVCPRQSACLYIFVFIGFPVQLLFLSCILEPKREHTRHQARRLMMSVFTSLCNAYVELATMLICILDPF
jgi:hypothetical protein